MSAASLTLRSISATPVVVPMQRPLWTSVQALREAPLLLLDLQTEEGIVGRSYAMPDAERIGGVSGWMDASALASAHEIELSSHLFPEVSVHLLAASPMAHWLEYVDWAAPLLQKPMQLQSGMATPSVAAGTGLEWDPDAVARFRVDGSARLSGGVPAASKHSKGATNALLGHRIRHRRHGARLA